MSKRWRSESIFGHGPRVPLNREQRARFRFLINAHRRAKHLTAAAEDIGEALIRHLSTDGRCDPSHDALAQFTGWSARTVRRAIAAMQALGLVSWQRRIVREGWRTSQTSNAYALATPDFQPPACGGHGVRGTLRKIVDREPSIDEMRLNAARQIAALGGKIPPSWGIPADALG